MWSEKKYDIGFYIGQFIILVLTLGFLAVITVDMIAPIEIDRYSFGAEITDKEVYYQQEKAKGTYLFYLRENDTTFIEEVDGEIFSLYDVGNWVEIEISTYETRFFHREKQKTQILGTMIED